MKAILSESSQRELSENTTFIDFGRVLQELRQYTCNLTTFWQIWSYHVTQGENVSFLYSKSYCSLKFNKVSKFGVSAAIPSEI